MLLLRRFSLQRPIPASFMLYASAPAHGRLGSDPAGRPAATQFWIRASMSNDGQGRNSLSGIKVMVIDDSNTIRRSAEIFLLQAGCTVILAEDGFDALAKIADHQPDLVFVDIMMPRLDGYQTCALIKKNSRFHAMPVVMLSSKDGLFDRARGRMVGSDQYLTKPFTKESLLKAVESHLAQRSPA
jgi:twitching motility two-component system response regulator PilG